MPIHILTKKAHPKLRYHLSNIKLGCDFCHRSEERYGELRDLHGNKLKHLSLKLPLLKHQDSKKELQKQIEELS